MIDHGRWCVPSGTTRPQAVLVDEVPSGTASPQAAWVNEVYPRYDQDHALIHLILKQVDGWIIRK